MAPLPGIDNAKTVIEENFHKVLGKIYTLLSDRDIYLLALETEKDKTGEPVEFNGEYKITGDGDDLKIELGRYFEIRDYKL